MNIPEEPSKFKQILSPDLLILLVLLLSSSASFALGYIAGRDKDNEPVRIEDAQTQQATVFQARTLNGTDENRGKFVASVSGTRYHLPDCPGAEQINDENKVYFATEDEAMRAGYTPAQNCDGL